MQTSQEKVAEWMRKFGQETPEKPTEPNLKTCQLRSRLSLEETLEKIVHGFGIHRFECPEMALSVNFLQILEALKKPHEFVQLSLPDFVAIRDGIADSSVVNLGDAAACGIDAESDFNEVMRSNDSKMWSHAEVELHFDEALDTDAPQEIVSNGLTFRKISSDYRCWLVKNSAGKILKSPSYSPANLKPILEKEEK